MHCKAVVFSEHASHRMLTRGITVDEVLAVIRTGEIIEDYPTDIPFPSFLLLGGVARALHVVVAADQRTNECIVVTVYQPDQRRWDVGFRTRRSS
ncbi:MAG: DUF4258 domain-containing protein [Chloroflexota bacterium]|nr:MAG: DUF4258 domain-containing protein [Chloroflexota bacterium]